MRFTHGEWALAGPPVRAAVTAVDPASPAAARIYLSALSAYLGRPTVWDRTGSPDLPVVLAADRIDVAAADPGFGAPATRRQRAEALRTLARAVGAPGRPAPARHTVDLTPTDPTRVFDRHRVDAHRDTDVAVEQALASYTPRSLPTAAWELAAADVRGLVAAAGPPTREAARVLASTVTAFLADPAVWDQSARPDLAALLGRDGIGAHVTRTRFATGNARANRHKFLTQLGRAAGSIPTARPRQHRRVVVDPFLAAGAVRPIPVATLAAARALTLTDRPVNLDPIAGAITRARDTDTDTDTDNKPDRQVSTEAALTALADLTGPHTINGPRTDAEQPVGTTSPGDVNAGRKRSRRAALAAAAEAHRRAQETEADARDAGASRLPVPVEVDAAIRAAVEGFVPTGARRLVWQTNRDLATRLVYVYQPSSPRNAANIATHLSGYLTWAAGHDGHDPRQPLALADLLETDHVEAFLDDSTWKDASRATARSVLRRIARNLRPHAAPMRLAHAQPGAPYTADDCVVFVRLAWHQPTPTRQRRLAFIIGLGLGAGLDAVDLRHLTPAHFEVITLAGRDVLVVHVPGQGPRARTVPVAQAYVPLVNRALAAHAAAGLGDADLVVANCPTAVNVATPTLDRVATADGTRHRITTARLRHTWLVAAMSAPVPMAELMQAAGIRSARTLTELLAHCPAPDPAQVRDTFTTLTALTQQTTAAGAGDRP